MNRLLLWIAIAALVLSAASVLAQPGQDYDTLVQKGKTQLQAGSNDLALASGEAAIKVNADRWEAYALAGGALMNLKRYEAAVDMLSHAVDRAPEAKQTALRDLRRQCLLAESGASPVPKETAPATTSQAEIVLWKSIESSANPADFQSYLDRYPNGAFAVLAQRHIDEMKTRAAQELKAKADLQREAAAELSMPTWTDTSTGLTWAKLDYRDAESNRLKNFATAIEYCSGLRLLQCADWRLPTADEFQTIDQLFHNNHLVLAIPGSTPKLAMPALRTSSPGKKTGEHVVMWLTQKGLTPRLGLKDREIDINEQTPNGFLPLGNTVCVRGLKETEVHEQVSK